MTLKNMGPMGPRGLGPIQKRSKNNLKNCVIVCLITMHEYTISENCFRDLPRSICIVQKSAKTRAPLAGRNDAARFPISPIVFWMVARVVTILHP